MATWQQIDNNRKPYIRMGENLFGGMYGNIRRSLLSDLRKIDSPQHVEMILDEFHFDADIWEAFEKFYSRTVIDFANDTVDKYKAIKASIETKAEDVWLEQVLEYVRAEVGDFISETLYVHREDIIRIARAAAEKGIEEGWGMDQIAKMIGRNQKEVDGWKALRIARTETVRASNYGVELGAGDLPGNKAKVWISSFTTTSREDHMAADGQQVSLGEWFRVGADELRYPGDPAAPPAQTINCRCAHEVIITDDIF